jgi:hypothetical protein
VHRTRDRDIRPPPKCVITQPETMFFSGRDCFDPINNLVSPVSLSRNPYESRLLQRSHAVVPGIVFQLGQAERLE